MSVIMKGAEVAKAMKETLIRKTEALKDRGVDPCLVIIRVGERADDLAYERGAKKRMELTGIDCRVRELPEDIGQEEFEREFAKINEDPSVHGILLFRPLPAHLDEKPVRAAIHPSKDADCMSDTNIAKVFSGDETGFAPCTAEAVVQMLDHFGIGLEGKKAVIVGRSMVVGRPLSMLLLKRNATVTLCHTRTKNLAEECRRAQILVAAAGKAGVVTGEMAGEDAVVVDVGINADENGELCGDVDFDAVQDKVSYLSPVPGGVGSVTTSVLASHVLRGACYLNGIEM